MIKVLSKQRAQRLCIRLLDTTVWHRINQQTTPAPQTLATSITPSYCTIPVACMGAWAVQPQVEPYFLFLHIFYFKILQYRPVYTARPSCWWTIMQQYPIPVPVLEYCIAIFLYLPTTSTRVVHVYSSTRVCTHVRTVHVYIHVCTRVRTRVLQWVSTLQYTALQYVPPGKYSAQVLQYQYGLQYRYYCNIAVHVYSSTLEYGMACYLYISIDILEQHALL